MTCFSLKKSVWGLLLYEENLSICFKLFLVKLELFWSFKTCKSSIKSSQYEVVTQDTQIQSKVVIWWKIDIPNCRKTCCWVLVDWWWMEVDGRSLKRLWGEIGGLPCEMKLTVTGDRSSVVLSNFLESNSFARLHCQSVNCTVITRQ